MSSVVETSQWRFLHSLGSVEMTMSVNMYIITINHETGVTHSSCDGVEEL